MSDTHHHVHFEICGNSREPRPAFEVKTEARLARIEALLTQLLHGEQTNMALIDDLQAKVAKNTDVAASALLLIQGLSAQLKAAQTDPAKLTALIAQLDADDTKLADAVAANTPAAPVTPSPTPASGQ